MNTVLIAEDEKFIRRGLVAMVQRAPVPVGEVLEARDGVQALEVLRSRPVDVLITDIRMPHMDGMELVEQLRTLPEPPLVLVVSGYSDFSYAVAMLRGGVQDYLLKPVERQKLYEALEKLEGMLQARSTARRDAALQYLHTLRYLMLDENMKPAEREEMLARYEGRFLSGNYVGMCAGEAKAALPAAVLPIHASDGLFLYVVPEADAGPAAAALAAPVGVSAVHAGLGALRGCYLEAYHAWQRAFFTGGVYRAQGGQASAETAKGAPAATVKHLMGLVGLSRSGEISRQLTSEARRVAEGELPPEAFAGLCAEFIRTLLETYSHLMEADSELARFGNIWAFGDSRQYLRELDGWLTQFCGQVAQEFADYQNKQKIRQAVQYIQKNFQQQLNMTIVSNYVSMNYSLFSLLFKQYTGTNFVSYLQELRVAEAERLLKTTDWKVNEIGRRVGFTDEKHFLKVFKAATGFSPTEFRRSGLLASPELQGPESE